jgi:hypothetical protein
MRRARLNQGFPGEEFAELTPEPVEASIRSAAPFYAVRELEDRREAAHESRNAKGS